MYCDNCEHIEVYVRELFDFLNRHRPDLLTFPLNIKEVILLFPQYKVWTYRYHAKMFNHDISQTENLCQSKSGCTFYNNAKQYIILYNDMMPLGRQRFTLAHELGHCIMLHFEQMASSLIVDGETMEYEADYFASTILCPFPVCKMINITSPVDIQHIFGLSREASYNQYKQYLIWKEYYGSNIQNSKIINYFHPFISQYS